MQVIVIGPTDKSIPFFQMLAVNEQIEKIYIVTEQKHAAMEKLKQLGVQVEEDWQSRLDTADVIVNLTGDQQLQHDLERHKRSQAVLLASADLADLFGRAQGIPPFQWLLAQFPLFVVTTDVQGHIQYTNDYVQKYIGKSHATLKGADVEAVFPEIGLKAILKHPHGNWHGRVQFADNSKFIMAKIPIIDEKKRLTGAAAIGAKAEEVVHLVEKYATVDEWKGLLQGMLPIFSEPYSIADLQGNIVLSNQANQLDSAERKNIVSEEACMHQKAQQSRRAVTTKKEKTGLYRALPLLFDGKLKGSIAVFPETNGPSKETELSAAKQLIRKLEATQTFADIIAGTPSVALAVAQAKVAAKTNQPILLRGEEGTGKKLFATAIHNESDWKYHALERVSCGRMLASPYAKWFFSQAPLPEIQSKRAVTLLLEDVELLSAVQQERLFRYLERATAGKQQADTQFIRFICTSSENLESAVAAGKFSKHLYYVLNRMSVFLPPLLERREDIPDFVDHFIHTCNIRLTRNVQGITREALDALSSTTFMQNIAGLQNAVEQAMLHADKQESILNCAHFSFLETLKKQQVISLKTAENEPILPLQDALENFEKAYIQDTYQKNSYNKTKTAEALNISIRNLYYKMEKYHIDKNSMQDHART